MKLQTSHNTKSLNNSYNKTIVHQRH